MAKKQQQQDKQAGPTHKGQWVGFDLDGTLAHYEPGMGKFASTKIGEPIPGMIEAARDEMEAGFEVAIVTGRLTHADDTPEQKEAIREAIRDWTEEHLGEPLECRDKDWQMVRLYDDRAKQVITNTGVTMGQLVNALRRALEDIEPKLAMRDLNKVAQDALAEVEEEPVDDAEEEDD